MDNGKIGELIRRLRRERGMTQLQLAQLIHVSDRTVSKWERGQGCPELSMIPVLSGIFAVDMESLLSGNLNKNKHSGGNVKRMRFYVCPDCGNFIMSMEETAVTCCGRKLDPMKAVKAAEEEKLDISPVENDYFITSSHPMEKSHYITFVAMLTTDGLCLKKQYPEWDLQVRIPAYFRGRLIWHCSRHGLFYQEVPR